ncbi:MAG TPA: hypothetical protein VFW05_09950 [Verrucomicrobiae bacterium]|nr:hypothetical protein [Verrucomicrobiae bacterium]
MNIVTQVSKPAVSLISKPGSRQAFQHVEAFRGRVSFKTLHDIVIRATKNDNKSAAK